MASINLQQPGESTVDLSDKIHQLPCCIKYTGPCSVSHYFKHKTTGVEVDGMSVEECCFRGRRLQGTKLLIPDGYNGFVLGKKKRPAKRKARESEENLNQWEMCAKFQNINYWNHDNPPTHGDAFLRSLHWLPLANALHKPVSANDIADAATLYGVKLN